MRPDAVVVDVQRRKIRDSVKVQLWVRAGGWCEFDGCRTYLLRHPLTLDDLNVGQIAHIVAFKKRGPRGGGPDRPEDINDPVNLMLVCDTCHRLIDSRDTGVRYTRATLQRFKQEHENRIFRLTAMRPERRTTVVELRSRIGARVTSIPKSQIHDALSPMYPTEHSCVVDLSNLDDDSAEYYRLAAREISRRIQAMYDAEPRPDHVSVFGLAPIPLLMHLGTQLSNKGPVDLYQRHRDAQDWTWKPDGPAVAYQFRRIRDGAMSGGVAILLSLSATVHLAELPPEIGDCTVYELTLAGRSPNAGFLRTREDLSAFRRIYHEALATISRHHGSVGQIAVFPATPAPIAIACGFELFPKVSPKLIVFDHDRRRGGWAHGLDVGPEFAMH